MKPYKILFFSTDGIPSAAVREEFAGSGLDVMVTQYIETANAQLKKNAYHAIVYRCMRTGASDLQLMHKVKKAAQDTPIILAVNSTDVSSAVQAMQAGAADIHVSSGIDSSLIPVIVKHARSLSPDEPRPSGAVEGEVPLIGKSQAITEIREAIELVSNSHTAVMITGESGTGKEVVARMIHFNSDRSRRPFLALNCAALPKEIIENELFGHERGAFTGALKKKEGNFEAANGGTLFFDEIAEMNPDTQAKLLRVIEQKSFRRLGGDREIKVDVRTIAATNKNLDEAMKNGEFRQDLYYRFSVIEIHLPPLRERKEDIQLLIDHFFPLFKNRHQRMDRSFHPDTLELLRHYDWPGNVRELRNVIERVVVTSNAGIIVPDDLPPSIRKREQSSGAILIPVGTTYDEAERLMLMRTLAHTNNNKSKTAKLLGISRKTLHNKLHTLRRPHR